jgi:hypothetical protein
MRPGPGRALGGGLLAVVVTMVLAGCGGDTPVYVMLQNSIRKTVKADDGRTVTAIDCTPHLKDVQFSQGFVHLSCHMRFADGGAYTTDATIEQRDYNLAAYNFHFDSPGPLDITTAALPRPATNAAADGPTSLFRAANLQPVLATLDGHVGAHELIVSLALYPSELVAVSAAPDNTARLITVHQGGAITVGPRTSFDGARSGVELSQLRGTVPQHLAEVIAARGRVPTAQLDRFVLDPSGKLASWRIVPRSGTPVFRAHVLGDDLEEIGPSGTKRL